jgi:Tfp pilus assembly protein FimT
MRNRTRRNERGLTLIELGVVAAIMMVIAALAVPSIINAVADFKLRTTATELSGLFQRARALAVQKNNTYAVQQQADAGTNLTTVWVDLNGNGSFDTGEPSLLMPTNVAVVNTGFPTGLDKTALGFSADPQAATVVPRFNARGLPCVVPNGGGPCSSFSGNAPVGFVYYLQQTRSLSGNAYVALAISPGGRMRVYMYTGSAWQ